MSIFLCFSWFYLQFGFCKFDFKIWHQNISMKKVSFNECTLEYLEKTFGLDQSFDLPILNEWVTRSIELTDFEKQELINFQEILQFNVHHWNEQELSLHFIGPIFSIAKLTSKQLIDLARGGLK